MAQMVGMTRDCRKETAAETMLASKGLLISVSQYFRGLCSTLLKHQCIRTDGSKTAQIEDIVTKENRCGSAEYCNHSSICRRKIIDLRRLVTLR